MPPKPILLLFDIDKTLTPAMGVISPEMIRTLRTLKSTGLIRLGIVGGSDRAKAEKQIPRAFLEDLFDVCFHENGSVVYRGDTLSSVERLEDHLSRELVKELTEYLLLALTKVHCPWRTGNFIDRRNCMINVSPIGRLCTHEQRKEFFEWDKEAGCRQRIVDMIKEDLPNLPLEMAIGGEISIDLFPRGFNKTLCLKHLVLEDYDSIHFFGDSVDPGGNDYELYIDPRVTGHRVSGPADTEAQVKTLAKIYAGYFHALKRTF